MIYTVEAVEMLLPGVWDSLSVINAPNPHEPDPEMPRSQKDPRRGNDMWAMIADVQVAWRWADLELRQKQVLFCVTVLNETTSGAASILRMDYRTASRAREDGLVKIVNFLNGVYEEDLTETYRNL